MKDHYDDKIFKFQNSNILKMKIDFLTFIMSFVLLGGNWRNPEFFEAELFEVHTW